MDEKPNAVLEGADHDSTCWIAYSPLHVEIPENVRILDVSQWLKMPLYGRVNFSDLRNFQKVPRATEGIGYSIRDKDLHWRFEMPRSLTTRDGRFYINPIFYDEGWEWYEPVIPQIIVDCANFFIGRESVVNLNERVRRAF